MLQKNGEIHAKYGVSAAYYSAPDPTKRLGYIDFFEFVPPPALGKATGVIKKSGNLEYYEVYSEYYSKSADKLVYITVHDFDDYWIQAAVITAQAPKPDEVGEAGPVLGTSNTIEPDFQSLPANSSNAYQSIGSAFGGFQPNTTTQYLVYALVGVAVIGLVITIAKTQFN